MKRYVSMRRRTTSDWRHMKSSELARMAGVSVRTLRHYHAIGLLPEPERADNGYREYGAKHLLRLLRIRQLATLGFSLEQIGPMIDELDAERQEADEREHGERERHGNGSGGDNGERERDRNGGGGDSGESDRDERPEAGTDRLLDDLDRQLEEQIAHLKHQRELIRHIRTRRAGPDYPERAAAVLEAIDSFERQTAEYGFLLCALTEDDKMAMGIAAHLYSDAELAEIERIFRAIPERGLTKEYLHVSHLMDTLPSDADTEEREEAIEAGLAFLDKISDCMDPSNWLRPDKDYERMLDNMAMVHYNDAQVAVSDELFLRFTERLAQRETASGV